MDDNKINEIMGWLLKSHMNTPLGRVCMRMLELGKSRQISSKVVEVVLSELLPVIEQEERKEQEKVVIAVVEKVSDLPDEKTVVDADIKEEVAVEVEEDVSAKEDYILFEGSSPAIYSDSYLPTNPWIKDKRKGNK